MAEKLERERRLVLPAVRLVAPGKRSRRAIVMWTEFEKPELLERDEALNFLLDHGCYQQVMEESRAWLKLQPYNLQAVESLLRAQWRSGDTLGALKSVAMALQLNAHEPGYRYMRGLLKQSLGMLGEAMEDFQAAAVAGSAEFRSNVAASIKALEDWQIFLLRTLLAEDRVFRLAFAIDSEKAVTERGFALTHDARRALVLLAEGRLDESWQSFDGIS